MLATKLLPHFRTTIISTFVLIASLLSGCSDPVVATPTTIPTPETASTATSNRYVASAKGRIDIEGGVVRLAARRDGVIEQVLVEEGAHVKAGDVLAVLDTALAEQQLALAISEHRQAQQALAPIRVRIAAAEREVARLLPLVAATAVSQLELDQARDTLALAKAELSAAASAIDAAAQRVQLAEREKAERFVRAPTDGQIIQRQARPGNGVSTLNVTPLFLFAPNAPRIVRAELEERFITAIQPGQTAQIELEADSKQIFSAQVLRIGRVVGARTPSDDPAERQDNRVVECVLAVEAPQLLIGQRVIARFAAAP